MVPIAVWDGRKAAHVVDRDCGGSGAGKTWLAGQLRRRLHPHAIVLSLDRFYRDLSHLPARERGRVNFDHPRALDWDLFRTCLNSLAEGRATWLPNYDFKSHSRRPQAPSRSSARPCPCPPTPTRSPSSRSGRIVLVEGLWPWLRDDPGDKYLLRLFRDTPTRLRLIRREWRDVRLRGRTRASVNRQWRQQSEPMFARFVRPQKRNADLILSPKLPLNELDRLAEAIRSLAGLGVRCTKKS